MPKSASSRSRGKSKPALSGKDVSGIHEFVLGNGLRVLHRENTAAPAVAVCVVYHVGSRNEAVGHTGSTHILEHLLFKDSKHFNKKNGKEPSRYLEWFGAIWNANTWTDRTSYYELMPKEHVDEALAVQADRMRNSLFSGSDLAQEMTVVRNEYERGRNNPFELLDEEMWATAFMAHPYHHPTIGWKEDIECATVEKLREFYDRFYYPDNATLILIGDLPLLRAKRSAEKYFGGLSSSPAPIPTVHVREGDQEGARYFELFKPGAVSAAALAYRIPDGRHADMAALIVLSIILAGGLSSRMQHRLVDRGMAADINVSAHPMHDPGLMIVTAQAADDIAPQALLTEMRRECARIAGGEPPAGGEVARAAQSLRAQYAFARDGSLNEARVLTEAVAAGDWKLAYTLPRDISRVSASDVRRVARDYLVPRHECAGVLIGSRT